MSHNHTPGPWFWHNDAYGRLSLRTPDRGQLIVMDFGRKGMQGATPRFAHWGGMMLGKHRALLGGVMVDGIGNGDMRMHPDANLIMRAPLLYEALLLIVAQYQLDPTVSRLEGFRTAARALAIVDRGSI